MCINVQVRQILPGVTCTVPTAFLTGLAVPARPALMIEIFDWERIPWRPKPLAPIGEQDHRAHPCEVW